MRNTPIHPPANAFSLVELAIVLVILGLLVGGVLSGKELIRASEFRSFIDQYQRYSSAALVFRDKYFALPGDITNATQIWGLQAAGFACMGSASIDSRTCDGDGNGEISFSVNSLESERFWQHLSNAGLIEGQYSGTGSTTPIPAAPRPKNAKVSNSRFWVYWLNRITSGNRYFYGDYGHSIYTNDMLPPEESYNLDVKLDDGKPATGKYVIYEYSGGFPSGGCTNGTSGTDYNAAYRLDSSVRACQPIFRQQF